MHTFKDPHVVSVSVFKEIKDCQNIRIASVHLFGSVELFLRRKNFLSTIDRLLFLNIIISKEKWFSVTRKCRDIWELH